MKPGDKVVNGRFLVETVLGSGSFGTVARVREIGTGRILALKELNLKMAGDPGHRERFLREAMLGQMGMPGIVRVLECPWAPSTGSPGDLTLFMVMEYLPGGTLADRMAKGAMPWPEVARIGLRIGRALGHLHGHGRAVHRDLKPDNVLFDGFGRAVVADLGIAHLKDGRRATKVGDMMGTPGYFPPEQAEYRPGDMGPWSDFYALAATMYEMGTGTNPHAGLPGFFGSPADQVRAIATQMPSAPSRLSPSIPPALDRFLMKNLAKNPRDRHQTAGEFCMDLCLAMGWLPLPDAADVLHAAAAVARKVGPALGRVIVVGLVSGLVIVMGAIAVPQVVEAAKHAPTPVASVGAVAAPPAPAVAAAPAPPAPPPPVVIPSPVAPPPSATPDPAPTALPVATMDPGPAVSGFVTASMDPGASVAPADPSTASPAGVAGEVRGTDVCLRAAPVVDPDNILTTLDEPQPVRLLGLDEGWYHVAVTVGGRDLEGYIWAGLVRPEAPVSGVVLGECRGDEVLLRQGPGMGYDPLGDRMCHRGEKLLLVGESSDGEWYQLQLPDKSYAWISAGFVDAGVW